MSPLLAAVFSGNSELLHYLCGGVKDPYLLPSESSPALALLREASSLDGKKQETATSMSIAWESIWAILGEKFLHSPHSLAHRLDLSRSIAAASSDEIRQAKCEVMEDLLVLTPVDIVVFLPLTH